MTLPYVYLLWKLVDTSENKKRCFQGRKAIAWENVGEMEIGNFLKRG